MDACPQARNGCTQGGNSIWNSQDMGASSACSRNGKEAGGQGLSDPSTGQENQQGQIARAS